MTFKTDRQVLYSLTETDLTQYLSIRAMQLGESIYHLEGVVDARVEGATLHAVVKDDDGDVQTVEISVKDGDLWAFCTCPQTESEHCAHIGAVLTAWVRDRESFVEVVGGEHGDDESSILSRLSASSLDYPSEYRQMLAYQTINELRAIAKKRGFTIHGTRKEPIIEELSTLLCDQEATRAEILALDKVQQEMLTYLHLTLAPGYGYDGESIIDGLSRREKSLRRSVLHSQIVDLSERGLLLTFKQQSTVYHVLPQAVRVCLLPRPDLVPSFPEQEIDQLEVREGHARKGIQKLYAVWSYIVAQHPRRPPAPARQQAEDQWPQFMGWDHLPPELDEISRRRRSYYGTINEAVTVPAANYRLDNADRATMAKQTGLSETEGEFWYVLLEHIQAISGDPGDPIATHELRFQQLLNLPPPAQMRVILFAWMVNTAWSEMDIILRANEEIRLRRSLMYTTYKPNNLYQEWRAGRYALLRFLSLLEENRWVSLNGFTEAIFEINPDIVHKLSDRAVWWLESTRTRKQFGTTFEDWRQSYGRFILTSLTGPLQWLGLVDLGYRGDQLAAFRLTPTGSFALGRRRTLSGNEQQVDVRDTVEFREDMTIALIPGRAPEQLHDLLRNIGRLGKATPERFVYRVTANHILETLEQGRAVDTSIALLSKWSGQDVPAAWEDQMRTWSHNYGKLHIYEDITLIEMTDDYALQELMVNTSLCEAIVHQFSPRLVAIRLEAVDTLVLEMEKRGYTPRVE